MEKGYAGAGSIGRVCELLKTASIWLTSIAGKILFLQPILAMIFVCNSKFMRSMTFDFHLPRVSRRPEAHRRFSNIHP